MSENELTVAAYDHENDDSTDNELDYMGGAAVDAQAESASLSTMFSLQFTPEDVQIPRIRLAQALTPEVVDGSAKAGQWILPGGKSTKTLKVTIIGVRKTRARVQLSSDGQNRTVLCRAGAPAGAALIGVGDPGGACEQCPFSQWTTDESTGARIPPECNLAYEYWCQFDDNTNALIVFQKTALQAGKELNTILAQRAGSPVTVSLGSVLNKRGNRSWYTPTVTAA